MKISASALKRDEAQASHQFQFAAALNALGSRISSLMSEKIDQEEGRKALLHVAEGIHLLADLQIFLGKNTADSAPIDEWLFGSSFSGEIKKAKAYEKVAREPQAQTLSQQSSLSPTLSSTATT